MSEHLSAHQFDECLAGDTSLDTNRHLSRCAVCQAELERQREPFLNFGHSLRALSDQQLPAGARILWDARPARHWTPFSRLSLALVAVALCLLLAFSLSWSRKIQPAAPSTSDAALLSQIDAEVSRSVPGPMEPLTEFVSSDSSHREAQ
jgi:hypothetical protein